MLRHLILKVVYFSSARLAVDALGLHLSDFVCFRVYIEYYEF